MAPIVAYHLRPRAPFHFGERGVGLEETGEVCRSDTLFGALCQTIVEGWGTGRLAAWLDTRPPDEVFAKATRLIGAILAVPGQNDLTAEDLVRHCESIASASGGMFGINRVSAEEREILRSLADAFKGRAR